MDFSYKIARVFGIDLEVHLLFVVFIAVFFFYNIYWAAFLLLVFAYVTMHEFAHALVAQHNKMHVRRIILLPIGGVSMMEVSRVKPLTEIKMTLAGPLSNLVVVYLCLAAATALGLPWGDWLNLFMLGENLPGNPLELFLFFSFYANIMLAAFNLLIPAFPLDGGRIFRAVLALKMDYIKATAIAKNVGLAFAGFMFVAGLFYSNLWLAFIGIFIAFGAVAEYEATLVHTTLSQLSVRQVVSSEFLRAPPRTRLDKLAEQMTKSLQAAVITRTRKGFRIMDAARLSQIPAEKRGELTAEQAGRPVKAVQSKTGLETILKLMTEQQVSMLPVLEGRRLVGVVKKADMEKAVQVKLQLGNALKKKKQTSVSPKSGALRAK